MARIETDPNYTSPTFSRATAPTDPFKKEDVQNVAAALSTHDHTNGKGLPMAAGSIPNGTITSAMIADGTIVAGDIADGAITSAKILDGTIATADHADASVTNAKLASDTARDQLLTNGGFEIWQRGNGPFTGNGVFAADRWITQTGAGATLSVSRDNANVDARSYSCAACTTTLGGGYADLIQRIETAGLGYQLTGAVVTFAIRVRTTATGVYVVINQAGTATAASAAHPGDGAYHTLVASGTLTGGTPIEVMIVLTTGTAYLDNATLVVGSVPADYAPLHPADDLARCQRYYELLNSGSSNYGLGQAFSTTSAIVPWIYRTVKAVTPTLTNTGATSMFLTSATATNAGNVNSLTSTSVTIYGVDLRPTIPSGLVAGNATALLCSIGTAAIVAESNP